MFIKQIMDFQFYLYSNKFCGETKSHHFPILLLKFLLMHFLQSYFLENPFKTIHNVFIILDQENVLYLKKCIYENTFLKNFIWN